MRKKGYKFYLSDNGIWLSNNIPSEFITVTDIEGFLKRYTYIKQEIKRIKKFAKQGSQRSQFKLALLYENGLGVKRNYYKAFILYNKILNNEDSYDNHSDLIEEYKAALYKLGELYEKGLGVKKNYAEAKKFYARVAWNYYYSILFVVMRRPLYEEKEERNKYNGNALNTFKKLAKKGSKIAQVELAKLYEEGTMIKQDYKEAMRWYKKAAEQGDIRALFKIGWFYEKGIGIKQSYRKAFNVYKKYTKLGNRAALYKLGEYYGEGYVVGRSNKKAIKYYKECNFNIRKYIDEEINYLKNLFDK